MGVFRNFPYSNFHEMNLDEMIKIIKNMLEEWAQYHAEWDAWMNEINEDWSNYQDVMNTAWQNMQDFINNYFDNLDVQNEINNKITSMVNSGEFATIVEPFIPPRVTAWLTAHITQPEGVVIDTSLSVSGACADAKATGDAFDIVKTNILMDENTLKKQADGLNEIQSAMYDEVPMYPIWEDGSYRDNGFDGNLNYVRCRFEAGSYTIKVTGTGFDFSAYLYDTDSSGTVVFSRRSVDTTYKFNSAFYISISNPALTPLTLNEKLQITKTIQISRGATFTPQFSPSLSSDVLKELYVPNLTAGWKIYRCWVESDGYRFGIIDSNNNIFLDGYSNIDSSYSDKIQKIVDGNGDLVAYYVLHYPGYDYNGSNNAVPDTTFTSNLNYNPNINEMLNRDENLVLIGDSIFGRNEENLLESFLNKLSNKRVFNCGFGGCRMSTENNNYKYFSFTGVCDAIASGDYSNLASNISLQPTMYPKSYQSLTAIDWNKPTTVFVNYVNNDITASVPIGDYWDSDDVLTDFDQYTVLGAMNYGINKLLTAYPHIRIVFFTPVYREMTVDNENYVPFYDYINTGGISANAYREGIKENGKLQGISVFDFTEHSGRNPYNFTYLLIDHSHWNIKGYQVFARILDALDKSYM